MWKGDKEQKKKKKKNYDFFASNFNHMLGLKEVQAHVVIFFCKKNVWFNCILAKTKKKKKKHSSIANMKMVK